MSPKQRRSSTSSSEINLRANPKAYRKPIQWQVDVDYLDKLSPADREWMLKFMEAEYGGNGHLLHEDQDECRRLWVQQKKQQRDALTYSAGGDSLRTVAQASPEDALIRAMDRQASDEKERQEADRKARVAARREKRRLEEKKAEQRRRRRKRARELRKMKAAAA